MFRFLTIVWFILFSFSSGMTQKWEWVRQISGSANDTGHSIDVDLDGNVFVAGRCKWQTTFEDDTNPIGPLLIGDRDVFVSKYSPSGDLLWAKIAGTTELGYDLAQSIKADNLGGCYITGIYRNNSIFGDDTLSSEGERDVFVSRMNDSGDFIWTSTLGGSANDRGYSVEVDANGNVLVGGYVYGLATVDDTIIGTPSQTNGFLARYNSTDGSLMGVIHFSSPYRTVIRQIVVDSNGEIYFCGGVNSYGTFNGTLITSSNSAVWDDALLVKCDSNLNVMWKQTGGSPKFDMAYDLAVSENNIYLCGAYTGTATFDTITSTFNSIAIGTAAINAAADLFVAAYTKTGNIKWFIGAGNEGLDEAFGVAVSDKEHIYFSGYFRDSATVNNTTVYSQNGSTDMMVARLDSLGNTIWVKETGNTAENRGRELEIDQFENIFVTGDFYETLNFDQIQHTPQNRDAFGGKLTQAPEISYAILDSGFCVGDTIILEFTALTSPVNFQYNNSDGAVSWIDSNLIYYIIDSEPIMNISGEMQASNNVLVDSLEILINYAVLNYPLPNLNNDTIICDTTASIYLYTDEFFNSYSWSNGVVGNDSILVSSSGLYAVTVTDSNNCFGQNEVLVQFSDCLGSAEEELNQTIIFNYYSNTLKNIGAKPAENFQIFSISGKLILNYSVLESGESINLINLTPGVYVAAYKINGNPRHQKFIRSY